MTRADVDGSVAARKTSTEDVGTPFEGDLCDCHDFDGDGWPDLVLEFDTQDVVEGLDLDALSGAEPVVLTVTARLADGAPFVASDCVRLAR